MTQPRLLIADIGGTHARFAFADPSTGKFADNLEYRCADHASVADAIRHYLTETQASSPDDICLAVAGPIVNGAVNFTNNNWNVSTTDLQRQFSATHVDLINDFEAKALALTALVDEERMPIGSRDRADLRSASFTVGVLGPGTGLGAAGLIRRGGLDTALVSEAGHASFTSESAIQEEIHSQLRKTHGRVSIECLLSGPGIENIYHALSQIRGKDVTSTSAVQIGDNALSNTDDIAVESLEIFLEVLGQVAGDFALTIGAFDGVFISGGIARRYANVLQNSQFRKGFENKGRYRSLMEGIPTELVTRANAGLTGASIRAVSLVRARQ